MLYKCTPEIEREIEKEIEIDCPQKIVGFIVNSCKLGVDSGMPVWYDIYRWSDKSHRTRSYKMNKNKLMNYSKAQLIDMLVKETAIAITTPSDALAPILEALESIKFKDVECFVCVTLNGSHKVIGSYVVSQGLVNRTLVHPREVFRPAILDNSTAIIIAHNHPSGNLEPSLEDKDVTRRMRQAGDIIGIKVLDHLIVSPSLHGYFSFLEGNIL